MAFSPLSASALGFPSWQTFTLKSSLVLLPAICLQNAFQTEGLSHFSACKQNQSQLQACRCLEEPLTSLTFDLNNLWTASQVLFCISHYYSVLFAVSISWLCRQMTEAKQIHCEWKCESVCESSVTTTFIVVWPLNFVPACLRSLTQTLIFPSTTLAKYFPRKFMGAVNHTGTSATLSSLKGLKWESSTLYSLIWEIQMKTFQDFGIEVCFHCVVVQNLPSPELLVTQHHRHSF